MENFSQNFNYLFTTVLATSLTLLASSLVYRNRRILHQKLFARLYVKLVRPYHENVDKAKGELFSKLGQLQSLDESFRSRGQIRILEIGVGPGSNFKYYPENTVLTAVDTNAYFRESLMENCSKYPHITLEKFVLCEGENMETIKDKSVDVVVTTAVLCSVRDVNQVLQEIKRVLAPGGKYFFFEHGIGEKESKSRRIQTLIHVIWSIIFDGCELTRDLGVMIEQAGFSETNIKRFLLSPYDSIFYWVMAPHVVGTAKTCIGHISS